MRNICNGNATKVLMGALATLLVGLIVAWGTYQWNTVQSMAGQAQDRCDHNYEALINHERQPGHPGTTARLDALTEMMQDCKKSLVALNAKVDRLILDNARGK